MLNHVLIASLIAAFPLAAVGQTTAHFEQDNALITYTGNWYPNTNSLESGGTATLANLKGSQAIVVFDGTGITWLGESDGYTGWCYVTLDGVQISVDTSNPAGSTLYKQQLFSVHGLSAGVHRLTIEITHSHDESTDASWIWIDGFDIDNGTLISGAQPAASGLSEQVSVAANYLGHWFTTTTPQYSGGSVNSSVDAGAGVNFTFNGTSVSWIGYRDEWSGLAQVYIDGSLQATVDTYLTPARAQTTAWTVDGLAPGKHVLSIVATGTHNSASAGSWIWIDAFQVSGSVVVGPLSFNPGGLVNSASFLPAPNNQVSPGQIVSLFGQNFTASAGIIATTIPLPTQLAPEGVSASACGRNLPLFSVSPGQINAQLPAECTVGGSATATVTSGGQTVTQTFTLARAAPGIFTVNGSGAGDGVILHGDNTLVTATKPATAGETVVIYATGLGATSPAFPTGTAANLANVTVLPVTVTVGGQNAGVVYSGLTQSLIGLYQINAVMPSGVSGSQPVVVTVGTSYSSRAGITVSLR